MIINLLIHPKTFFEKVRGQQVSLWPPVIILIITGILDGIVTVLTTGHTNIYELASRPMAGSRFLFLLLTSNLNFYLLIAAQTFLFHLIIKKLGGTGGTRRQAFYILGMSTLPILIQSIIHLFFPQTVWWQYFEYNKILYFLSYSLFNLANIWSVALLIIGFAKVYNVSYKKSSILYLQFLLKIIPLVIIMLLTS